jgi:hypothetical protein
MNYFVVETIYYKKRFIVCASTDLSARTKVSEWFAKNMNLKIRITELESKPLPSFMGAEFVREV